MVLALFFEKIETVLVVELYVSDSLKATRRSDLESPNTECICLEICNPTFNIFLCCIYTDLQILIALLSKISRFLDKVSDISNHIIVLGDFNVNFLNMPNSHKIYEILLNFSLIHTIHEATRITQNAHRLIDPILVTEDIYPTSTSEQ